MIHAVLLSLFTLYPWNLGAGGEVTVGSYSNGLDYTSKGARLTLDRKNKDSFELGYLRTEIGGGGSRFEQDEVHGRVRWWSSNRFQLAATAASYWNGAEESGWYGGLQAAGNARPGSAALAWTLVRRNRPLGLDVEEFAQIDAVAAHDFGPHNAYLWGILQAGEERKGMHAIAVGFRSAISEALTLYLEHGFGRLDVRVDPWFLFLDNNSDNLRAWYRAAVRCRFTPNIALLASFVRNDYEPVQLQYTGSYNGNPSGAASGSGGGGGVKGWDYSGIFLAAGLQVRF